MYSPVQGFHRERAKGDAPTIRDRLRPNLTLCVCFFVDQTDIGGSFRRILTLHFNYVAIYTGPLLFLFERTHNYSTTSVFVFVTLFCWP